VCREECHLRPAHARAQFEAENKRTQRGDRKNENGEKNHPLAPARCRREPRDAQRMTGREAILAMERGDGAKISERKKKRGGKEESRPSANLIPGSEEKRPWDSVTRRALRTQNKAQGHWGACDVGHAPPRAVYNRRASKGGKASRHGALLNQKTRGRVTRPCLPYVSKQAANH